MKIIYCGSFSLTFNGTIDKSGKMKASLTGAMPFRKMWGAAMVHNFAGEIGGDPNGTTAHGTFSADERTLICPKCTKPENRETVLKNGLLANWNATKTHQP